MVKRSDSHFYSERVRVDEARAAAADWVQRHQAGEPGFRGAYFAGSIVELADDALLPATSDVDVVVVLAGTDTPPKLGKLQHRGVLLEVTQLPEAQLADAEAVAGTFFLAPSFRTDQVISDPTGLLRRLLVRISSRFAEPGQIRLRCDDVLRRMAATLASLGTAQPWPEQVTSCLFGVSLPTLVVLVAAQRNPTVRLRYLRARSVLQEQGRLDFYEALLAALGCAEASPVQVQRHLDRLAVTFDRAASVGVTSFFFSNDITPLSRPIAIAGTQGLIDAGDHREAVFWLLATFSRCQQILRVDAPELAEEHAADFDAAVADLLGCRTAADLRGRADEARALLPELHRVAAGIVGPGESGEAMMGTRGGPETEETS
jgi:hypothetical protein